MPWISTGSVPAYLRKQDIYGSSSTRPLSSRTYRILLRTSPAEIVEQIWNLARKESPFGYVIARVAIHEQFFSDEQAANRHEQAANSVASLLNTRFPQHVAKTNSCYTMDTDGTCSAAQDLE